MKRDRSQIKDEGRFRKTELHKELGISRPTLDKYLNMEGAPIPDTQSAYDLEQVANFIAQIKNEEGKIKGKNYWESEKARLHCEKLLHELAVQRGEYISKSEASKTIIPIMAELGQLLKQKFELELPSRYQGKDRIECAQLNADAIDYLIRRFRSGVKDLVTT